MGRNVEIKARLVDPEACFERARAIADGPEQELAQRDTFFASAQGRLKLRELSERVGCLIYYERPDAEGPKLSRYILTETGDPSGLRTALAAAWGVIGEVRKRRRLLMVGRTRIHIDAVDGLGDFLELEVVLGRDEPVEAGEAEARRLMTALGIGPDALVTGAYHDLLQDRVGAEGEADSQAD